MAKAKKGNRPAPALPVAFKLAAVQERLRGTSEADTAKAFGVSGAAIGKWLRAFRKGGPAALESGRANANKPRKKPNTVKRDHVVALKQENQDWGSRRIRDVLARFEAVGISEQQVRRILHDEGLIEAAAAKPAREHGPRRFERAMPNQLWQSDIFTFRLRRAERLYACVFMDDHSRFIVGHSLAHHQKSALVMEAFERGIAAYGQPTEVLTDNGRQYTVWRGRTEFEEALQRMGIQHIRSRPQHPQTLGKVERFWKTLWDEFLGRTVFAHVVDAQQRLEHFISHYNFQRPHQALDGLVPADRFFKAAAHVRVEIERAVAANELRLALEQPPRKPFYVVGQLGDQRLSISAGEQGLQVHVGDSTQTIPLKEPVDGTSKARHFAEEAAAPTPESYDAEMADGQGGPRRGRPESRADVSVGDLGREDGDDGDRGEWDFAESLLSAGDQGAERDAIGARAGSGRGSEHRRGEVSAPYLRARSEAATHGAGSAPRGAAAAHAPQADAGSDEDATWTPAEESNLLDASWAERLALVDDDDLGSQAAKVTRAEANGDAQDLDIDDEARGHFDGDAGWRERGPEKWERKLAGANAVSDRRDEDDDAQGPTADLHTSTRTTDRSGAPPPLRGDHGRAGAATRSDDGSRIDRDVAQSLPDDPAPRDQRDHRSDHAEASGPASEAGTRSGARSGECEAPDGARVAGGSLEDDRPADGSRGWDCFWEDAFAAIARAIEEEESGGPRTRDEPDGEGHD
jgi:transposase InsO family protein